MTREEAIRRIKSWNLDSDDMEVLSVVIPELRESEDERIRKGIIEIIKAVSGPDCDVYLDEKKQEKYLAWLEKQKEQIEELSIRLNGLMQEYVKSGKDEEEQEHRLKCYQLFWDALSDSEFFEQKEQKPVEWSDTDNIGWDEAFACITRAEKAAKNEEELQNAVIAEKWLKEIKFKYYVHPVKQEWSEEDEKMLNLAIEWAETMSGQFSFVDMDSTDFHKIIAWLKSLRPPQYCENCKLKRSVENWKPSDEQMEADLEVRKRIEELANDWHHKGFASDEDCPLCMQDLMDILWHFYELGKNSKWYGQDIKDTPRD